MAQIIYGKTEVDNLLENKQDAIKTYSNFGELRQDIIDAYNNDKAIVIYCKNFGVLGYYYSGSTNVDIFSTIVKSLNSSSYSELMLYFTTLTPETYANDSLRITYVMYKLTRSGLTQSSSVSQDLDISRFRCIIG